MNDRSAHATGGGESRRGPSVILPGWADGGMLLVLAVWAAVSAWRPFLLGFYHDDWYNLGLVEPYWPFSWQRLVAFGRLYANRPLVIPVHFLLSSICNQWAAAWQAAGSALLLVAAIAGYRFLQLLSGSWKPGAPWAAAVSVCLWLLMPWSLGYRLWPIAIPALVAIATFAWAGYGLVGAAQGRPSRWWVIGLAYLASISIYEVFYGMFALLAALALLAGLASGRLRWRGLVMGTLGCAAAQGLVITYSLLARPLFEHAPKRHFEPMWWWLTRHSIDLLPSRMSECLDGSGAWVAGAGAALGVAWAGSLVFQAISQRNAAAVLAQAAALACAAAGMMLSVVVFASANYEVVTIGGFSRTMLGIDLWLTVAATIVLSPLLAWRRGWATIPVAGVVVLGAGLAWAYAVRSADWAKVWVLERDILRTAPLADLRAVNRPAVVVLVGTAAYRGVGGFGAPWDLNSAVHMLDRSLSGVQFLVSFPQYPITWDGERVVQQGVGRWEAAEFCVWTGESGDLQRLDPPATIPVLESAQP